MGSQQQPQHQAQSYEAAPSSSSRPTLGFPLGTALLLIVIFCLSGMLSCCDHWDKLQSLRRRTLGRRRRRQPDDEENATNSDAAVRGIPSPPSKACSKNQCAKLDRSESMPVIMPGDQIPKFIAWPCPCDPPSPSLAALPPSSVLQLEKISVEGRCSSATPPPPPDAVSCATAAAAATDALAPESTVSSSV